MPFVEGGRDRNGWDCYGLLRVVYREQLGIELPVYSNEYTSTDDHEAVAAVFADEVGDWEPVETPAPGDVVWCAVAGRECHVGVYSGPGRMLHVLPVRGTTVERITGPIWARRIRRFYRHKATPSTA